MKNFVLMLSIFFLVCACSNKEPKIENLSLNNRLTSNKFLSQKTTQVFPADNFGVGPVKQKIELKPIDIKMSDQGREIFQNKCSACHRISEKYVGPKLADVTKRRSPEWIMNMILNPIEMTQVDPIANGLLAEYLTQMTFQNVTIEETRKILEYFRQSDFEIEVKRRAETEAKIKAETEAKIKAEKSLK